MLKASDKVWVCEEGHVDDHHLEDGGVCPRCGGGGKTLAHMRGDVIETEPCGDCGGSGEKTNLLCSRCGGTCEQFTLDGLAREYRRSIRALESVNRHLSGGAPDAKG